MGTVELRLFHPDLLEAAGRAAYEEAMIGYAEMTPALPPELEEMAQQADQWPKLRPMVQEHWRRIAARAIAAAFPLA